MPTPFVTCLLVAAVLLAQITVVGGLVLALVCAFLEAVLPLFLTNE